MNHTEINAAVMNDSEPQTRSAAAPAVSPELPTTTWRAILALLGSLPQGTLSRGFGAVADIPLPRPLRAPVLGAFARAVGIDRSEVERPIDEYETLNQFFVRRLAAGARSWPADENVAGSPVDGIAGQVGTIRGGRIVQAKGRWYSAAELLDSAEQARAFDGGAFATLYLSPRHYHRIHAPTAGRIDSARHIPGALLPVNGPAVAHVQDLFARNERLLAYLDGPLGRVAMVAVGAYNVGRISAAFDPLWSAAPGRSGWVTNRRGADAETRSYDPPVRVRQGDEVMAFHLGSTVVLLFEPGRVRLAPELRPGVAVRLGEPLCHAAT